MPNKYPALAAESEARDSSEQFYRSRRGLGARRPGWSIRVVPNKYPAVTDADGAAEGQSADRSAGVGIHEVIIESPKHVSTGGVSASQLWRLSKLIARACAPDVKTPAGAPCSIRTKATAPAPRSNISMSQLIALAAAPKAALKELRGARHITKQPDVAPTAKSSSAK